MPARAYWKGYLRLSLVTIGIELFPAVASASETALHQILNDPMVMSNAVSSPVPPKTNPPAVASNPENPVDRSGKSHCLRPVSTCSALTPA